MSDAQTQGQQIYVKVASVLMVVCLLYGALSLSGIIR